MSVVTAEHIYPVKGMQPATRDGGQPTDSLIMGESGFELYTLGDRGLFVAAEDGAGDLVFVSPRGWDSARGPRTAHAGDSRLAGVAVDLTVGRSLHMSIADVGSLALRVPTCNEIQEDPRPVGIHRGRVWGLDLGRAGADFASEVIGRPARLMLADSRHPREVGSGQTRRVLAADGYPALVASQASLDELNRLDETHPDVPMRRYRPNIVVDSIDENRTPFAEDYARELQIARLRLRVAKACSRCIATNVDENGQRVGGGLRVLRPRYGMQLDAEGLPVPDTEDPYFAINVEPQLAPGERRIVAVGDAVTVTEWSTLPNVKPRKA